MKNVVMQTRYGTLSRSREFQLFMCKYDVITGQCAVCDIREKVFKKIFTNVYNTTVND